MFDKIRVSRIGYAYIYYVNVNDKWYEIRDIKIYNENGIIYNNERGYFEDDDEIIDSISITQPMLRRKENFSKGENFIISNGKGNYDRYSRCTLYIHESEAKFTPIEQNILKYGTFK